MGHLVVEANYVDFGSMGSVVEVTNIRTVRVGTSSKPGEPEQQPLGDFEGMSGYDGTNWI
jgi:hypothetical protein